MKEKTIRTLLVEPEEVPREHHLHVSMQAFRAAVGVDALETENPRTIRLEKQVYILYNHWGGLWGKENRKVGDRVISGDFYVIACDDQGIPRSLTHREVKRYLYRFFTPESFEDSDSLIDNLYEEIKALEEAVR